MQTDYLGTRFTDVARTDKEQNTDSQKDRTAGCLKESK